MSSLANVLIAVAVMALVVSRQLRARKLDTERRFWLLPAILAVVALRGPGLIDSAHRSESVGLLVASVVAVLAMGSVWGWTVRLWRDRDGAVWAQGTKVTLAAWGGMVAIRIGLYALGSALHVHQGSNALLLSLAALLLVRGLVVDWRARSLEQPCGLVGV
ncbi:CcdC protein domain-containing protein [Saccharothrix sp. ST-888]|uniref:CcdC protein domain-containing protein n=1 Tax=Saccharothrix sp. ST-888 TaxID=1427391 RepID=UPI0005EC92BE|nr:CcdC protein domain-containing protein [Saccharothrix sp. ST-888]